MAFVAAGSLLLAACSTPPRPRVFPATGDLVELNVITLPVGLDLDGRPGLDGFSIKVFGNTASNPKPVPIRAGTLEVVMFDGSIYGLTNLPPPLKIWSFSGAELRQHEFTARIGTGYEFLLAWGTNVPTRRMITVGARYTAPDGRIMTSSPSSVTVIDR